MRLNGKTAIVTGGFGGIGSGIVRALLKEGVNVLATYYENHLDARSKLPELQELAEKNGARIETCYVDIRMFGLVKAMFDTAENSFGGVDILVANAGTNMDPRPIWEFSEKDFDMICDVNFKGTWMCASQAASRLRDGGRIILISSSSVPYPVPGHTIYSPAKAAVEMLARNLALEVGPRQITVNALCPGLVPNTGIDIFPQDHLQKQIEASPMGRLGTPEDIAGAVLMLCAPQADYVSGQIISVNGGSLI